MSSGHAGHAATFPQVTAPSTDLSGALETGSTPLIITTCAVADRPTQAHRHRRCRIHDGRAGHVTWAATGHSTVSRTSSTSPKHACTSPPRPSSPRCRRAVTAGGHFPTEQAALKTLYLVTRGLDPKGTGQARWTMPWKPALNAFAVTFADRNAGRREPVPHERQKHR